MKNSIIFNLGLSSLFYASLALVVLVLPVSLAMADGGESSGGWGGMMGGFGPSGMWAWGGLGMLLMPIFWLAFLALAVFVVRKVWDAAGDRKKK